ncbi:MAG: triose-phosphate isomerase [Thermoplasmata archaeon]|nr:MAG: triose-phosphate isomerase [Thermoplasmata archaeon]
MNKLKPPIIILNFKAYKESCGNRGLTLAKICQDVSEETGVTIVVAPQQFDLALIAKEVNIPCLAQHVDALEPGSFTGWTTLLAAKEAGAIGSIVNHSEHAMKLRDIEKIIRMSRDMDMGVVACSNNLEVSRAIAELGPYSIAIEPPKLIGTGIPVSKAEPQIVSSAVEEIKRINKKIMVLCGAGISTGEDVKAAIELGAEGVLLASGVVKAKNPRKVLLDLASF